MHFQWLQVFIWQRLQIILNNSQKIKLYLHTLPLSCNFSYYPQSVSYKNIWLYPLINLEFQNAKFVLPTFWNISPFTKFQTTSYFKSILRFQLLTTFTLSLYYLQHWLQSDLKIKNWVASIDHNMIAAIISSFIIHSFCTSKIFHSSSDWNDCWESFDPTP